MYLTNALTSVRRTELATTPNSAHHELRSRSCLMAVLMASAWLSASALTMTLKKQTSRNAAIEMWIPLSPNRGALGPPTATAIPHAKMMNGRTIRSRCRSNGRFTVREIESTGTSQIRARKNASSHGSGRLVWGQSSRRRVWSVRGGGVGPDRDTDVRRPGAWPGARRG